MLRFLRIRNLAVIEGVEVEFEPGFNVLTGETGAGKSILIEAVGLLLGARASADLVRTGETQASIEAMFDDASDDGGDLIVRREITSQGRSRSFVNGALATAGALRDLSLRLVEMHGQHDHQALLDPLTHLPLLDQYAGLDELAGQVGEAWSRVRALREQLERSRMDSREKAARLDLIAFQLGEIGKAAPRAGEDEELAATRHVLASAERIQRLCSEGYAALYDSDQAVLAGLGAVWKRVGELAAIDSQFAQYVEARDGIKSQLEDLAFFLRSYAEGVDASPERLQQVEDRLALLERLKRKYGPSLQDVIDRGAALKRESELLSGAGESAAQVQAALAEGTTAYLEVARRLSSARRSAALTMSPELEGLLGELAMPRTRVQIRFNAEPLAESAWGPRGIDQAELFLSPNPGEDLRPLARIVSGGELSRVMLALKTLQSAGGRDGDRAGGRPASGATLIFDEVDAGIGGRAADIVGARLQALGSQFQVLCITHLPHIASRSATHFRIEKHVQAGRTVTSVTRLDQTERVEELARMIGGTTITEAVRASAREMLQHSATGQGPSAPRAASRSTQARSRSAKTVNRGLSAAAQAKAKGESERRKKL